MIQKPMPLVFTTITQLCEVHNSVCDVHLLSKEYQLHIRKVSSHKLHLQKTNCLCGMQWASTRLENNRTDLLAAYDVVFLQCRVQPSHVPEETKGLALAKEEASVDMGVNQ